MLRIRNAVASGGKEQSTLIRAISVQSSWSKPAETAANVFTMATEVTGVAGGARNGRIREKRHETGCNATLGTNSATTSSVLPVTSSIFESCRSACVVSGFASERHRCSGPRAYPYIGWQQQPPSLQLGFAADITTSIHGRPLALRLH